LRVLFVVPAHTGQASDSDGGRCGVRRLLSEQQTVPLGTTTVRTSQRYVVWQSNCGDARNSQLAEARPSDNFFSYASHLTDGAGFCWMTHSNSEPDAQ
jgi:hypothetical protein